MTIQSDRSASVDVDQDRRPVDPATGRPLPRTEQPGYYPGFSTLDQQPFWDEATRAVIMERFESVPPIRFFDEDAARTYRAVFERLLPQDDRVPERRIPLVNYLDMRLWFNIIDGYRFEDMPSDQEAYKLGHWGIDAIAQHLHNQPFAALGPREQDDVLWTLHDANPPAGSEIWDRVPADRFWLMMVQDAIEAYYAQPWAWDEIGFGGPAYPRGYFRLERGEPEPWEVREQRYDWQGPPTSTSDRYRPLGGRHPHAGQEGTH